MAETKASEQSLPFIVRSPGGSGFSDWLPLNREEVETRLLTHGAVLFRGFGIGSQDLLQRAVDGFGAPSLRYVDGNSPRQKLGSGVYTSTEYPPEFFISLHNELSYSNRWPSRVFFCCVTAPREGGETPLADSRAILQRLPAGVRDQFVNRKVKYIRNLHGSHGFGPSWQTTFETESREEVEAYLQGTDTEYRWNADGSLTVMQLRPAVATHPVTGEAVWFNQADQFHPSTHPPKIYESMLALYRGREELIPQTACFGDGSPIEKETLDEVRKTVAEEMRLFPWQEGDLLMVDNMLVAHGRRPFTPPRKILVAMT